MKKTWWLVSVLCIAVSFVIFLNMPKRNAPVTESTPPPTVIRNLKPEGVEKVYFAYRNHGNEDAVTTRQEDIAKVVDYLQSRTFTEMPQDFEPVAGDQPFYAFAIYLKNHRLPVQFSLNAAGQEFHLEGERGRYELSNSTKESVQELYRSLQGKKPNF